MSKNYLFILFCALSFSSTAQVKYTDVASIFFSKCASCHNSNGIANSDFTNYAGTAPYANTISNYVQNNIMPPWPPDTTYSRFTHERALNAAQKTAILQWVADGALSGDLTQVPAPPTFAVSQLHGTPDKILKIPNFTSQATAADTYVCFAIPSGLTQDVYLRAYEIIPSDPTMVHHVVMNVDTTGTEVSDLSGQCYNQGGQFSIGDFAPGAPPMVFPGVAPVKFGMRIKAGSKIIMQMHYPAGSAGKVDSTQVRFYFYPVGTPGIRPLYNKVVLTNWLFAIPANTVRTVTASYPKTGNLQSPISLYSVFPHSHQLCTSIENYAKDGSNNKINLINIPNWQFHWQAFYTYRKMLKIPAGYKLHSTHVFDNTTNNPHNPNNPTPITVTAGTSTDDEMVFDGIMWVDYQAGDENVDIESILAVDPLLTGFKEENKPSSLQLVNTFPNPFEDKVNIGFTLNKSEFVTLCVFNVLGEKVTTLSSKSEAAGYTQKVWSGTNQNGEKVSPGVYMYNLQIGKETHSGKIILNPAN